MTDVGRMSVGELLGRVLADEHADVSCDAVCCLAQQGKGSRRDRGRRRRLRPAQPGIGSLGDATSPNASTPPTPPQPTPPLVAALSQPCLRDFHQFRQCAPRRRGDLG